MKKYFVVETNEICEFGDVIDLTFSKELEDGRVTVEKEITFSEETKDVLVEIGYLEEREIEDKEEDTLEFCDDEYCPHDELLQEICNDQGKFEEKLKTLEGALETTNKNMAKLVLSVNKIMDVMLMEKGKTEDKNAKPKKK